MRKTLKISSASLERILKNVEEAIIKEDIKEVKKVLNEEKVPARIARKIKFACNSLIFSSEKEKKGSFLVISGIDKSGKETHAFNPRRLNGIKSIYELLLERIYKVLKISLPSYQTTLGSLVAGHLGRDKFEIEGKVSEKLAWILWALDRAQYARVVSDWLSKGKNYVVLAKRWVESNVVYQMAQGVELERIVNLERNLVKQDYTIVLDVSPEVALTRRSLEGFDIYEVKKNLDVVRRIYLDLPKYYPFGEFYIVDASREAKDVNKDVLQIVDEILRKSEGK